MVDQKRKEKKRVLEIKKISVFFIFLIDVINIIITVRLTEEVYFVSLDKKYIIFVYIALYTVTYICTFGLG